MRTDEDVFPPPSPPHPGKGMENHTVMHHTMEHCSTTERNKLMIQHDGSQMPFVSGERSQIQEACYHRGRSQTSGCQGQGRQEGVSTKLEGECGG